MVHEEPFGYRVAYQPRITFNVLSRTWCNDYREAVSALAKSNIYLKKGKVAKLNFDCQKQCRLLKSKDIENQRERLYSLVIDTASDSRN